MGGFGIMLFMPAYFLLQKDILDYKSLLLFETLFFANPHLISSYLRVYTQKAEIEKYQIYTIYIPIFLLTILVLTYGLNGLWWIGSVYFYWQWWHHARQSFGIGRKYAKYQLNVSNFDLSLNDYIIWVLASIGIILKSNLANDYYEGIPLRVLHLPGALTSLLVALGICFISFYLARQIYLWFKNKTLQMAFLAHLSFHSLVFIVFFGLLPNDLGIIAASFWHCTQYIYFVRNHQEQKLNNGALKGSIWTMLLHKNNWLIYLISLFMFSFLLPILKINLNNLHVSALLFSFSMGLTFHHYLLDAVIWTRKEISWSLSLPSKATV
jgi:hypothetical protein